MNRRSVGGQCGFPIEPEVYNLIFTEHERDGLWPLNLDTTEQYRRSIYLYNKRGMRLPLLHGFRSAGRYHVVSGATGEHASAASAVAV